MFSKIFLFALAASPLVAAHGKVTVVTGDAGGNGTGLAIQGAVVPGTGPNRKVRMYLQAPLDSSIICKQGMLTVSQTEVDTTVFGSTKIATDGLGKTTGTGRVKTAMLSTAMDLSGSTLPQVSNAISGTWLAVTSDGCGPVKAVLDPSATGSFSNGTVLTTTTDVPGTKGNCPKSITKKSVVRSLLERSGLIGKRATNVNVNFPMAFSVPAGTTCTGTVSGQSNVCLVKIANNNNAGPFGSTIAVQMAGQATTGGAASNATIARRFNA